MANPTALSLRFAFAFAFSFSFSITTVSSQNLHVLPQKPIIPKISLKSSSPLQTLASDLLSLLGSRQQSSSVPAGEAAEIRSCLRFLVPFRPSRGRPGKVLETRRDLLEGGGEEEGNEMVWWPPAPVMELARLAVDSRGDPAAIQRLLDPTVIPVPDVEGLKNDKCQLTRTPYGRRFANTELNSYFEFLFEMIAARAAMVGFNVSLSRYDLFHGHLFLASNTGRLGILFHAKEYPSYDKEVFPYNMGFCQTGSNVNYDDSINLRNILWLAPLPSDVTKAWVAPGTLVVLDAHPEGIIYKQLVPEYVDDVRTIYEDDFGELVADVNYLNIVNVASGNKIFIC
ncbi:uncharacterized protein M6B38_102965 [Iris pallida]|uniref:Uncharacterized protein n=1 Tax=Iris pallida TaxID=29817 RepID=A0AAX6G672_IRIPA|nr:uncharacterized protein M6B38_102965 [Iris pallida]